MRFKVLAAIIMLGSGQGVMAEPDIHEGLWEVTAQVNMTGIPVKIPPVKHSQCITKDNLVPENAQKNTGCKITRSDATSNTVSWDMTCDTKQGVMTGKGEITYQKETFDGTITMNMDSSEGAMNMVTNMSGHYIGACN